MEVGLLVAVEPQGNGETIDNSQFTIDNSQLTIHN